MSEWHGYEQHPDALQERPWWRRGYPGEHIGPAPYPCQSESWVWHRGRGGDSMPWVAGEVAMAIQGAPGVPSFGWVVGGPDDIVQAVSVDEVMALLDAAHPLPAPPPRCGQVWVGGLPLLAQSTITAVLRDLVWYTSPVTGEPVLWREWPPRGAVLVAGPGSPWAPTGGE